MNILPNRDNQIDRKSPRYSRGLLLLICFLGILFLLNTSCRQEGTPKPMAYPRIAYPKTGYSKTNNLPYPIFFEYPSFARLEIPNVKNKEQNWVNIKFDKYRATLLTGYSKVDKKDIQQTLVENESIIEKEIPPYTHIKKQEFESKDKKIIGYLYEIEGNTACPLQFMLTDQNGQIFRGALYFNYIPNRDSIRDIIGGLTGDVRYLMESFRFKH